MINACLIACLLLGQQSTAVWRNTYTLGGSEGEREREGGDADSGGNKHMRASILLHARARPFHLVGACTAYIPTTYT